VYLTAATKKKLAAYISPVSPLYLPYTSPTSPVYLTAATKKKLAPAPERSKALK
jgi:hypothetical protein